MRPTVGNDATNPHKVPPIKMARPQDGVGKSDASGSSKLGLVSSVYSADQKEELILAFSLDTNLAKKIVDMLSKRQGPVSQRQFRESLQSVQSPQLSPSVLCRNIVSSFKSNARSAGNYSDLDRRNLIIKIVVADGVLFRCNIQAELNLQGIDIGESLIDATLQNLSSELKEMYLPQVDATAHFLECDIQWVSWDEFLLENKNNNQAAIQPNVVAFSYAGTARLWTHGVLPLSKLIASDVVSSSPNSVTYLERSLHEILIRRMGFVETEYRFDWAHHISALMNNPSANVLGIDFRDLFKKNIVDDELIKQLVTVMRSLYSSAMKYCKRDKSAASKWSMTMPTSIQYIMHETSVYASYLAFSANHYLSYRSLTSKTGVCPRDYAVIRMIANGELSMTKCIFALRHAVQDAWLVSGWKQNYKSIVFKPGSTESQSHNTSLLKYLCIKPVLKETYNSVLSAWKQRIHYFHEIIIRSNETDIKQRWMLTLILMKQIISNDQQAICSTLESLPKFFELIDQFEERYKKKQNQMLSTVHYESSEQTKLLKIGFPSNSVWSDSLPFFHRKKVDGMVEMGDFPLSGARKVDNGDETKLRYDSEAIGRFFHFFHAHGLSCNKEMATFFKGIILHVNQVNNYDESEQKINHWSPQTAALVSPRYDDRVTNLKKGGVDEFKFFVYKETLPTLKESRGSKPVLGGGRN
jgi:hypothetical protein